MKFVRTAIQTESAIFANCSLWVRQNFQMSQLICHSKNSITSQSKQHDIHSVLILNEAHDFSYSFSIHVLNEACVFSAARMQLCSLISSAVWYHLQFDIICSLISSAVWYCQQIWYDLQFDIIHSLILCAVWYCLHSFYFSFNWDIVMKITKKSLYASPSTFISVRRLWDSIMTQRLKNMSVKKMNFLRAMKLWADIYIWLTHRL